MKTGYCLTTLNLQIFTPNGDEDAPRLSEQDKRVLADLPALMENVEESASACLPEGYEVRATEWNK